MQSHSNFKYFFFLIKLSACVQYLIPEIGSPVKNKEHLIQDTQLLT
jgi:hypothetical protein